jgi:hypothetical protein
MRKLVTVLAAVLALAMLTATVAMAGGKANKNTETLEIIELFNDVGDVEGEVSLTRRPDGLTATAKVTGLHPGGVYTFWWVAWPSGGAFPDNAFVASGGARVAGNSGKATVRMNAETGQASIDGFLIPFNDLGVSQDALEFDLETAEVHVEIAYHGQKGDADGNIGEWRSDFWTGTECPQGGAPSPDGINADYAGVHGTNPMPGNGLTDEDFNAIGQPHCRVSYAFVSPAITP